MTESELYKNLGILTKGKDQWEENIPFVASLLSSDSTKIKAKALWLLGEMGLNFPLAVKGAVPAIAAFCDSAEPLLRERAVNALGAYRWRVGGPPHLGVGAHPFGLQR